MYPCNYPGCKEKFENHTFLMSHILRDHAARMFAAVLVALVIALALWVSPARADSAEPPSVGEPPTLLHLVYLPIVASGQTVQAAVSWCPSCRG